jgi:hypothetical protein
MSLQHAAKHLAAHGRGKDTELIHMDRGEIASLQQIAKANGGSLTINPHTGLPEAGFLSALLPMVAGAGLMAVSGGAINPLTAGFLVGGLKTAQSGSLKEGLMAGFSAYGGAGLAASAGAAGATQAGIDATNQAASAAQGAEATQAAQAAAKQSAINAAAANNTPALTMTAQEGLAATAPSAGLPPADTTIAQPAPTKSFDSMSSGERVNAMKQGASFSNAGDYIAANPKTSLAAATGVAYGMKKDPAAPPTPDKDMGQRYSFTGNKAQPLAAPDVPTYEDMLTKQGNFGRQQNYFVNPTYTPINPTAAKDLYHFAGGGPVEMMSDQAALGTNTMYPMANMTTSAFATPYQDPRATNMMSSMAPSGGGAVNSMSGEPNMQGTRLAEGGEAEESRPSYTYDPQTQKYAGGPSMGGISNAPQDFGASAAAALDNFSAGVARDGMTTPMGSYIPPSSNGIPSYTYDPQTRQYQQMAGGGISGNVDFEAPQSPNAGPLEQLIRAIHAKQTGTDPMKEATKYAYNQDQQQYQQMATGGISDAGYNLGGYSDGGRLLRGPGDGVSDSIPATIGRKQPARLADGEFVVPARIVSELGNGSTEAGARKLYAMMDRVQASRKNTVGKGKVAKNNRADKYLPA